MTEEVPGVSGTKPLRSSPDGLVNQSVWAQELLASHSGKQPVSEESVSDEPVSDKHVIDEFVSDEFVNDESVSSLVR